MNASYASWSQNTSVVRTVFLVGRGRDITGGVRTGGREQGGERGGPILPSNALLLKPSDASGQHDTLLGCCALFLKHDMRHTNEIRKVMIQLALVNTG